MGWNLQEYRKRERLLEQERRISGRLHRRALDVVKVEKKPKVVEAESYQPPRPNVKQLALYNSWLHRFLTERKNKSFDTTRMMLECRGYVVRYQRVVWSGGVGSWRVMRGGNMRIQVGAACWGYHGVGEFGYKYAECVEIDRNGHPY